MDTNLPLVGQLRDDPELSSDAAIDTLRIQVTSVDDDSLGLEEVLAPDTGDWPVSFGIAAAERRVRVRIKAFRGKLATLGEESGELVLLPPPTVAIDRLLELELPESGVREVSVLLDGDCIGVVPSYGERTSCIDGTRLDAPISDGASVGRISGTQAGDWWAARAMPCSGPAPNDALCIAGGYSVLGSSELSGILTELEPVPLIPVVVSPFFIDETELTVGRFRDLVNDGFVPPAMPKPASSNDPYCSWRGLDDPSLDDHALSCIDWDTARAVCEELGGRLPSEAEWEHAARGRGQGRLFAWGDSVPECCTASLARIGLCGSGPEPVASHLPSAECAELGDVTRDGVIDMAGGLAELTMDIARPFDHACWYGQGPRLDPICEAEPANPRVRRGGDWAIGRNLATTVFRGVEFEGSTVGVRCAYDALP